MLKKQGELSDWRTGEIDSRKKILNILKKDIEIFIISTSKIIEKEKKNWWRFSMEFSKKKDSKCTLNLCENEPFNSNKH